MYRTHDTRRAAAIVLTEAGPPCGAMPLSVTAGGKSTENFHTTYLSGDRSAYKPRQHDGDQYDMSQRDRHR
jgi:hypothetical protein